LPPVFQQPAKQKPEEIEERTYEVLGKQLGIDPKTLKEQLPRFAEELKKSRAKQKPSFQSASSNSIYRSWRATEQ
jgi:hypothetical protein